MKLTTNQKKELVVWKYFMPIQVKEAEIRDEDLKMFFEWSERGLHKDKIRSHYYDSLPTGFDALYQGKKWAGIHMHELYEPGVLEGIVPYCSLLGSDQGDEITPREVVDFMKKEMFKGVDTELIEKCYQEIING